MASTADSTRTRNQDIFPRLGSLEAFEFPEGLTNPPRWEELFDDEDYDTGNPNGDMEI